MKKVKAVGPLNARIALVGEAPGGDEEVIGEPFRGAAGSVLNMKLHNIGLARQTLYITNLCKYRPSTWWAEHGGKRPKSDNDFSIFWKGTTPTQALLDFREELLNELCSVSCNVVVALGANALWALTGYTKIDNHRGSVYNITLPNGRNVQVIGTRHPAAVLRQWYLGVILEMDLRRARDISHTNIFIRPKRSLLTNPTKQDVANFLSTESKRSNYCMYDIETSPTKGMTCISFAYTKDSAISIPTTLSYWGSYDTLREVLYLIHKYLTDDHTHVAHNASFDIQYLSRFYGILPTQPWDDTMLMMHACHPELRKGLDFVASIFTFEPYYKDDLKQWQDGIYTDDKLYEYNARDAAVQYECMEALQREMDSLNVLPIYHHMRDLLEPLLFMTLRGVRIDNRRLEYYRQHLLDEWDERQAQVFKECGVDNPKFVNSPKQLIEWMLSNGMTPPKKHGRYTTEKTKLQAFYYKYPMLEKVIEARETRKLIGTYLGVDVDTRLPSKPIVDAIDRRIRCSYNITGTETGRLSSNTSIFNCGYNLQNVPKRIRDIFVPDPGLVFTEADLKGAEAMIVAYLANEPAQIKVFEEGGNIHIKNAMMIYSHLNVTPEEIKAEKAERERRDEATKSMYYRAKKVGHSANYLATKKSLSETLRISPSEAAALLQRYYIAYPNIRMWHKRVEYEVTNNRVLVTPLGRRRAFYGARVVGGVLDDQTLRDAVAFVPQETSAHVLNLGLINVYREFADNKDVRLALTVHDSLLIQHPPEMTTHIHERLNALMSIPLTINNRTFTIPVEIETGKNWKDLEEVVVEEPHGKTV